MSLRVNKAKKFNGKAYVATDELDKLLSAVALSGNTLTLVGASQTVEGDSMTTRTVDLKGLVTIANNSVSLAGTDTNLITVANNKIDATGLKGFIGTTTANKIVGTNAAGKLDYTLTKATAIDGTTAAANNATYIPTASAVKAYVDGHGISLTSTDSSVTITNGDGVAKNLATNLYIKKLATATSGYAATYQLQIGNGTGATAIGDKIDIVKDQFLKSVAFIPKATAADVTAAGTNPGFAANDPVLKFTFDINTDGKTTPAESESVIYVPVKDLVDTYTNGNGIDTITSNIIKAKVDSTDKIYTAKGSQASVLSLGASGIKASGIQAAIDLAVNDEHSVAATAISSVNTKVETFQTAVNGAITSAVNVASAAISSTTANINSSVNAAITSTNNNVSTSIAAASTAISTTTTNINTAVSAAVTKAVELEETEYTFGTTTGASVTSGVATITGVTGNVLAVFDADGAQVYPDITKSGKGTAATNTLSADYGSESTTGLKWTVLHTKAIAYTNASPASITAYTKASYGNATAAAPAAVAATNYDNSTTVGALSYNKA